MSKQSSMHRFPLKWSISKWSSIGLSLKWSMKGPLWNVKKLDIGKALSGMKQYHVNRILHIARRPELEAPLNLSADGALFS